MSKNDFFLRGRGFFEMMKGLRRFSCNNFAGRERMMVVGSIEEE